MRSGPDRRCASYCTWSSRSRTTVLESADDQWRTPVTRGNLDNSCAEAGELAGSPASEIASEASFASVAGGAGAVEEGRAVFQNIRKFLTYVLVHNVAELVPYLAFALFRIPLPLTPIQ